MIRRCDGNDPNLIAYPHENNVTDCPTPSPTHLGGGRQLCGCRFVPCTCGRVFDDVQRMTVYPHHPV